MDRANSCEKRTGRCQHRCELRYVSSNIMAVFASNPRRWVLVESLRWEPPKLRPD